MFALAQYLPWKQCDPTTSFQMMAAIKANALECLEQWPLLVGQFVTTDVSVTGIVALVVIVVFVDTIHSVMEVIANAPDAHQLVLRVVHFQDINNGFARYGRTDVRKGTIKARHFQIVTGPAVLEIRLIAETGSD